jgi:hypothetical protein
MPHPISEKVLQEILRAFAWDEAALPSKDAVRELAAAGAIRIRPLRTPIPALIKRAAAKAIRGTPCQLISQNRGRTSCLPRKRDAAVPL